MHKNEHPFVRRSEEKANGSGQQLLMKTQLLANFEGIGRPKKEKLMSGNVNFFDKVIDREKQVLKVYNNRPRTLFSMKVMR